jgi:hypothetical protein
MIRLPASDGRIKIIFGGRSYMNSLHSSRPRKGSPSLTILGAAVAIGVLVSFFFLQSANAHKPAEVTTEAVVKIKY